MKKRTRRLALAVVAVSAFGLSSQGLLTASATASPAPPHFATDHTANAAAATAAQNLMAALAKDPHYGGIRITDTGVVVSVVGPPSASQSAVARTASDIGTAALRNDVPGATVPVTFELVNNSQANLEALSNRILADLPKWHSQGIDLSDWGPDAATNKIEVELANYTPVAALALTTAYGDTLLRVDTASMTVDASAGRTSDAAPWYGGDSIHSDQNMVCTTWFPAIRKSDGHPVLLTSGHCKSGYWSNGVLGVGSTSTLKWSGDMDGQTILVTSTLPRIWANPTTTTRNVISVSMQDPSGTILRTDGSVDLEVCNVVIDGGGRTITYDGVTISGLVLAHQLSSFPAFTPGDSGGPIGATVGSTGIIAYGMIAAHQNGDNSREWYVPARTIQSEMGVAITTS